MIGKLMTLFQLLLNIWKKFTIDIASPMIAAMGVRVRWGGYVGRALVLVWNSALRGDLSIYFSGVFC